MADAPAGRLTTHVLDTSLGRPAKGVGILLDRIEADGTRVRLAEARTNADGRCDTPLLSGDAFRPGTYELLFEAGPYLAATLAAASGPLFLDDVVIRVRLGEEAHYHVPLLLSPFGYTTYRGS